MTNREKLIELLLAGMGFTDNKQLLIPTSKLYYFADYLISHGVSVKGKGEWITHNPNNPFEIYGECSNCGFEQSLSNKFNFCPNCGADMRKRKDIK